MRVPPHFSSASFAFLRLISSIGAGEMRTTPFAATLISWNHLFSRSSLPAKVHVIQKNASTKSLSISPEDDRPLLAKPSLVSMLPSVAPSPVGVLSLRVTYDMPVNLLLAYRGLWTQGEDSFLGCTRLSLPTADRPKSKV